MPRRLRYAPAGSLVEVTCRTLQARFLMLPTLAALELILGVLGRAQESCGMIIHAFVFLSNHYHLLLSPDDSKQLADFMCFLNSNIARELGRLHGWRGHFFERRYQAIAVSDEEAAQTSRLFYLLSHGVKEGLVLSPADWPGAHTVTALLTGDTLRGAWFNRTAEFDARRKGVSCGPRDFATTHPVRLSPLPCWTDLPEPARRERVAEMVAQIEREGRQRARQSGRAPLGVASIRGQHPHDRPASSKRSPAPSFHAATKAARLALMDAYRAFLAAYRSAADRLRNGERLVLFPAGSFPPPMPFARGPAFAFALGP